MYLSRVVMENSCLDRFASNKSSITCETKCIVSVNAEAVHGEYHKNAGILNNNVRTRLCLCSVRAGVFSTPSISTRDINKLIIGHVSLDSFDY